MYSTSHTPLPSGIRDSLLSAAVGAWGAVSSATVDYWLGALNRRATPFDLAGDLMAWTEAVTDRKRPQWAHEHTIAREWPIARLRDYSTPEASPDQVATVILPPQAGHDSSIVDFARGKSQIITARENGCHRIYAMEWVGATQETKDTSIDDYMALLREAIDYLGGTVNLVGDCQGGWVATIFAALHPERVNTLAIAGAPIDFHAGEPLIYEWVQILAPQGDLTFYKSAVDAHDGLLPGRFLLDGFNALQPAEAMNREMDLLNNLDDAEQVQRYRQFEDWFQWTQPLPGAFFLWIVEHLFIKNSLIKGELEVEGRIADLAAIDCPLFLMAGERDHITPAEQVWALADYVSTPASKIGRHSAEKGHLGLFMGRSSLNNQWREIFTEMALLSSPDPDDDLEALTDEPTGTSATSKPAAANASAARTTKAAAKAPAAKASAANTTAAKTTTSASSTTASQKETASNGAKTTATKSSRSTTPKTSTKQAETTSTTKKSTASRPKPRAAAKKPSASAKSQPASRKETATTESTTSSSNAQEVPTQDSTDSAAPVPAAQQAAPADQKKAAPNTTEK